MVFIKSQICSAFVNETPWWNNMWGKITLDSERADSAPVLRDLVHQSVSPRTALSTTPLHFYLRRSEHFYTQKGLVFRSFLKTWNAYQGHFNYVVAPSLVELSRVNSLCNDSPVAEYKCFCAERNAKSRAFFPEPCYSQFLEGWADISLKTCRETNLKIFLETSLGEDRILIRMQSNGKQPVLPSGLSPGYKSSSPPKDRCCHCHSEVKFSTRKNSSKSAPSAIFHWK